MRKINKVNMFQSKSTVPNKSAIQNKRESLQLQRAHEEKEKKKKSMRFQNRAMMILSNNASDYDYILGLKSEQVETKLRQLMELGDLTSLVYSIEKIGQRSDSEQVLDFGFFQRFIEFSEQLIYRPQIIFIYKMLAVSNKQFFTLVFERKRVIKNIVHEIQTLKESTAQQIYLEVLQHLTPSYIKRHSDDVEFIFDVFSQTIENRTVEFRKALKILKAISPYINQEKTFSISTIQRIIQNYQDESQKSDPSQVLMVDCFIVLVKVIYYQKETNIITNYRLMKLLLHAKMNLPSKVVEQYYNVFVLLARLVQKTAEHEMTEISKAQAIVCEKKLMYDQNKVQILNPISQNYLTSLVLNRIFGEHKEVLNYKEFSNSYLNFILKVVKYCAPQIIVRNFIEFDFFNFLIEALTSKDYTTVFFSLQIILAMLSTQTQDSEILNLLKYEHNVQEILEEKLYTNKNKIITNKIQLILEKFDLFNGH